MVAGTWYLHEDIGLCCPCRCESTGPTELALNSLPQAQGLQCRAALGPGPAVSCCDRLRTHPGHARLPALGTPKPAGLGCTAVTVLRERFTDLGRRALELFQLSPHPVRLQPFPGRAERCQELPVLLQNRSGSAGLSAAAEPVLLGAWPLLRPGTGLGTGTLPSSCSSRPTNLANKNFILHSTTLFCSYEHFYPFKQKVN